MAPLVTVGLNTYPDGGYMHVVPYLLGLRDPYPGHPSDATFEGQYDSAYAAGAYDATWRAILAGVAIGVVGMIILRR